MAERNQPAPEGKGRGRVEIRKDKSKKDSYRWHAIAANGEPIANGEGHTRPEDAERAWGEMRAFAYLNPPVQSEPAANGNGNGKSDGDKGKGDDGE